ncbi:unnamed protein product [Pseudo-nitzschia multistriata]|uniref:Uncharacterized protein n=1 Tax=Pseudo-nitzschia multistriata TaxID=183589 RepID=A0A448Z652_9STRA|nr:unnamed protein product [Pseudo-nitzschia multistriata]
MVAKSTSVPLLEDKSPSTKINDDDDSGNEGFPSDEDHLIHEILKNRSWMKEDIGSEDLEDDELEKEMEMLSVAEQEVSQEISDAIRSFQNQLGAVNDRSRRKSDSRASRRTVIRTEGKNWETHYTSQEKPARINQEILQIRSKRKIHTSISNIRQVEIDAIERDTRDSVNESHPSDEACHGVYDICNRDPPEEMLFIDDDESYDEEDDSSNVISDVIPHMSTNVKENENENEPESVDIYSLKDFEGFDGSPFAQWHREEEGLSRQLPDLETGSNNFLEEEFFVGDIIHENTNKTAGENTKDSGTNNSKKQQDANGSSNLEWHSEEDGLDTWDQRAKQISDLEWGKAELFEEEAFWKEGFETIPVPNSKIKTSSSSIREDNRNASSGKSHIPSASESRRSIIEILALPTLEHHVKDIQDVGAKFDRQPIQSASDESVTQSVHAPAESTLQIDFENNESIFQKSTQLFHSVIEDSPLICIEESKNDCSFAPEPTVLIEEAAVRGNEKPRKKQNHSCDLRTIILAVHVVLAIVGIIVFLAFLLRTDL